MTNMFVAKQIFDEQNFVVTIFLSWQAYFCHDKRHVLSRQTHVCRNKYVFVVKTFVTTKMILVAAPADDSTLVHPSLST